MRFLLIILLLIANISFGQNLVQNYSFENLVTCNNFFFDSNSNKWYSTKNTPDYLSTCFSNNIAGVPLNMSGLNYQLPRTGNAYVGILTFNESIINDREYFANLLVTPLVNNAYYLIKFYTVNSQCSKYTASIQLSFTSNLNYSLTPGFVSLTPSVYNYTNSKIKDTLQWKEIIGIYKANGTEQYVTIGNFINDSNSKIDTTDYDLNCPGAYCFIDDVSVEPICTPFWSYRDTTVAIGDSVLIGPAITGLNINWYDATSTLIANAPGIYVKPAQTTTYTAVEDFCGNTYTNTIVVTVTPTAVREYEKDILKVELYPNPANNKFTIVADESEATLNVIISDVQGKKLQETTVNVENYEVGLQVNLPNGIYIVSIRNNTNYKTSIKKLVIQK